MINETDRFIAAHAVARTKVLSNGSKVIPLQDGLFDLFQGEGWKHQSRFRIIKLKGAAKGTPARQLIQVSGLTLSQELRNQLLKEVL